MIYAQVALWVLGILAVAFAIGACTVAAENGIPALALAWGALAVVLVVLGVGYIAQQITADEARPCVRYETMPVMAGKVPVMTRYCAQRGEVVGQ